MEILDFGEKVKCLFSTRADGNMRLHDNPEYDRPALDNRARFLSKHNVPQDHLVRAGLIHSNFVEVVSDPKKPDTLIKNCDALITGDKNVFLSTTAADCFPVYFYDPVAEVVGIIHAGWKGILRGVIEQTFERAQASLNVHPEDVMVYIGPGIRSCHFEVKKDVAVQFPGFYEERRVQVPKFPPVEDTGNNATYDEVLKYYVDLESNIYQRLIQIGVRQSRIHLSRMCTFCYKAITEVKPLPEKSVFEYQFFSFRREKSDPLRTGVTVIGMV